MKIAPSQPFRSQFLATYNATLKNYEKFQKSISECQKFATLDLKSYELRKNLIADLEGKIAGGEKSPLRKTHFQEIAEQLNKVEVAHKFFVQFYS